eukprot:CAMPEP_0115570696 /NCGR_PEP_ID=MMETSP0271-20121206/105835_1 /TAXON_ID=71861 /ORGANISM="Scrippsiella trochoidea, Strain CCMP3099" /LENGTH=50 /DNA_ID=CAMNT_0003005247 /DNA_START=127 /DNA_END=279 /DNA_ORIENTATION=-
MTAMCVMIKLYICCIGVIGNGTPAPIAAKSEKHSPHLTLMMARVYFCMLL